MQAFLSSNYDLKEAVLKEQLNSAHFGPSEIPAETLIAKKKKKKTDQEGLEFQNAAKKKDIFPQTGLFLLHNLCLQNTRIQ